MTDPILPAPTDAAPPEPPKKRKKLREEQEFDTAVYGGLGGVVITGLSMISADWINYGAGKEKSARTAQRLGDTISRWTGMAKSKSIDMAHSWLITTGLMVGGLVMLYPLKKAEDGKAAWIRNRHAKNTAKREACGEVIPESEKAEAEAALAALDREPKQTWGSIAIGRVVGTVGVYGAMGLVGGHIKRFATKFSKATAGTVAPHSSTQHALVERTVDSGVLEGIATAICTSVLYVYTHAVHPHKKPAADAGVTAPPELPVEIAAPQDTEATGKHTRRLSPMQDYRRLAAQAPSQPPSPTP